MALDDDRMKWNFLGLWKQPVNDDVMSKTIVNEDEQGNTAEIFKINYFDELCEEQAKKDRQEIWDYRFLDLAHEIAKWSKDPSRKVGAVIVRPDKSIVSLGYNGFARGVLDEIERYENRDIKYEIVVHAEVNAIVSARQSVEGCTLYSTLFPCSRCAGIIINSGIRKIVSYMPPDNPTYNSKTHPNLSTTQFDEAQLEVVLYHNTRDVA